MALILVFISGLAGLIYQVLWMKQLGLLFGNTSQAAAVTLAAFFAGLAAGSWLWGRRCERIRNPLRAYAWLELGTACSAGLYFVILHAFYAIYPSVYAQVGSEALGLAVKFALAMGLVFPPALFMGGTIPVMGQYLIGNARHTGGAFGSTAAWLYAVNTFGAALGALLAGFFLPLWLGFSLTCLTAMLLTAAAAAVAFVLSRAAVNEPTVNESTTSPAPPVPATAGERWPLLGVCFVSGFGFLALEVVWTRMFLQVLENSVYTYSAILVVVLVSLAAGAYISSQLARLRLAPKAVLAWPVILGGLAVAITPFVFMKLTDSLQILASRGSWASYVLMIFKNGFVALGMPALILGAVFPFLMKTEERYVKTAGVSLGRLGAINTLGAILGAILCGFVFLPTLGMWGTMLLLAAVYLVVGQMIPVGWTTGSIVPRVIAGMGLLLLFTVLDPTGLPITSTDPMRPVDETVVEKWEASDGTVAVVRSDVNGIAIKINSHYSLGTTAAFIPQRMQSDLPLLLYPKTKSIVFLGMGTGITAGGALDPQFDVQRIVVCELSPHVIEAAETYIAGDPKFDFTSGLFEDERATILAEDGRHYLMATRQQFDMINGDLFVPYRAGIGSLYSKEHFQNAKDRLTLGGVFVQWLPLYQLTEYEFHVIARTMLEVFDQVSLWRLHHQPGDDTVALIGHRGDAPLPATDQDSRAIMYQALAGKTPADAMRLSLPLDSQTVLFFYCGNVTRCASLFEGYPVNTDDRPVIEYMAPRSYRQYEPNQIPWFIGPPLAKLVDQMQRLCPPASDPLLVNRSAADRRLPLAGAYFYKTRLWQLLGDQARAYDAWQRFVDAWLNR